MYHVGICLYLVIMCMHVLQTHRCSGTLEVGTRLGLRTPG